MTRPVSDIGERKLREGRRAACEGLPVEIFFPEESEGVKAAVAICKTCDVMLECREMFLDEQEGVWGGLSANARKRERVRRRRAATVDELLEDVLNGRAVA